MAKFRIGVGSDFVLKDNKVGIGSTVPREKLDVAGTVKGDFIISSEAFFDVYAGFTPQIQNVSVASTVGFTTSGIGTFTQVNETETGFLSLVGEYGSLSEDVVVDEGDIFEVSTTTITGITTLGTQEVYAPDDSVVSVGTLESVSIQSHFSVPDGGTNERPDQPVEGMVRFNDDLNTLEFYNGIEWRQFTVSGASGRGVFITGQPPGVSDVIDYVNIATLGNAVNFGTSTVANRFSAGCSDGIRGVFSLGYKNPGTFANELEYITIASEGNSIDFGDSKLAYGEASVSSSTRGIWGGGQSPSPIGLSNVIDYIQIQTLGNTLDFGDLTQPKDTAAGCSSPTRGVFGGGRNPSIRLSEIDFITISSTGNAIDFGDLTQARRTLGAFSNSTRGIFGGGYTDSPAALFKTIDFITIASTGNAQTFGELPYNGGYLTGTSSQTRGVFGGASTPSQINNISYVTINSTGNAQDFGDLTVPRSAAGALSDSHGGLGGF
jgi:hypothetical protein